MSSSEIEAASLNQNPIEGLTKGLSDANSELEPGLPSPIPQVVRDGLTISAPPYSQDDAQAGQAVTTPTNRSTEPSHHTPTGSIPQASLGAWVKPLAWLGEATAQSVVPLETVNWPALSGNPMGGKRHRKEAEGTEVDHSLLNPTYPTDKTSFPTDKTRFPWTARLNPKSRNLHRVTMPEYMEDGTPKVTIPNHVLRNGLQNQKEFIIGQFCRCLVPSGGLVHAILNKIWGRRCNIFVKKISESSYIFHIPDESTRKWVLERGLWHVDECLMFVAPWNSSESLSLPEINTIPLWVTLKNIPTQLYYIPAIEWIASALGEPMLSHKPWLDPTMLGEAKIMVEVELDKPFPQKVAAWDKQGNFSMVDVEYSWLPKKCENCGQLGHKAKRCLSLTQQKASVNANGKNSLVEGNSSPVVGFPKSPIMPHTETSEVQVNPPSLVAGESPLEASNTPHISVQNNSPSAPAAGILLSTPDTHVITDTESNVPELGMDANVGDLISLATITELENIYVPPALICINEEKEYDDIESSQAIPNRDAAQAPIMEHVQHAETEQTLGTNKFAALWSFDEEEDDQLSSENSMDHMTPSGKRILRDRPVKPSAKAKEMHLQFTGRGRGNRGRGNRGRSG